MPIEIYEIFMVDKGKGPIDEENILQKFVPKVFEAVFLEEGKMYTFSRTTIGYPPIGDKNRKDFLVTFQHNGIPLQALRFSESKNGNIKIIVPTVQWKYKMKTDDQISSWYDEKTRQGVNGFESLEKFLGWYRLKVQDKSCDYCGITERESQEIIHNGLLRSSRFPLYGKTSQGVNRGYWLEVDRKEPKKKYSPENCVPACYFCNNDKSDVFNAEQYKSFVSDRIGFLRRLSKFLNKTI